MLIPVNRLICCSVFHKLGTETILLQIILQTQNGVNLDQIQDN